MPPLIKVLAPFFKSTRGRIATAIAAAAVVAAITVTGVAASVTQPSSANHEHNQTITAAHDEGQPPSSSPSMIATPTPQASDTPDPARKAPDVKEPARRKKASESPTPLPEAKAQPLPMPSHESRAPDHKKAPATPSGSPAHSAAPDQTTAPQTTAPKKSTEPMKVATPTKTASAEPQNPTTQPTQSSQKVEVPGVSTVGVPARIELKVHRGDIVITKPNTVINGLEVHGTITVRAPGAVIKNSKIVGGATPSKIGLINNVDTGASFSVIDSELVAAHPSAWWNGVYGSNFTVDGANIHGVIDAVRVVGSNVTIRNSWLHGNLHYESDPLRNGTPSHDDSIQIQGGNNILIENSRLEDADNAAVQITQEPGKPTLGTIEMRGNFLQGGACTVNIASTPSPLHPALMSNVFGPQRRLANCAVIAPKPNAPILAGNTWGATGLALATYSPGQ